MEELSGKVLISLVKSGKLKDYLDDLLPDLAARQRVLVEIELRDLLE